MQADSGNTVEPIFELKFGQVDIANLRLRGCDVRGLHDEIQRRIQTAPKLFARAPMVLVLGSLSHLPDIETTRALLDAIRSAGMLPVGIAYGTQENE